ncbi:MAG: hypothetical protein Q4F34_02690, partial [Prevotellaceae bacterium]|nr:hypothetical protein [Prevotellaceae bacterium]
MKKILFTLVALCATMSIEAQKIEIYDKGELVTTYYNEHGHEYKVVFKEIITGTAKRTGDIDVKWVRLWAGGPKFAEY